MDNIIFTRWSGKYCTVDEVSDSVMEQYPNLSKKTIIWKINQLVKNKRITRVGRGVYLVSYKAKFSQSISNTAKRVCKILTESLKYLDLTITDTSTLGEFMTLRPFSTVVNIEVRKAAINAAVTTLRREKVQVYIKSDYPKLERYVDSNQPILISKELSVNPTMQKDSNVRLATIEKILVDLVSDADIYGQYQDTELLNIYRNATEMYAINYSQLLKYAAARGKKEEVVSNLQETSEYMKVRHLL